MMKSIKVFSVFSIGLVAFISTASCSNLPLESAPEATICELTEDSSLDGRAYAIEAMLKTDNLTFSALVDQRCTGSGHRIQLDGESSDADRSVRRFFGSKQKHCEQIGKPALCGISAQLRAEILIERDDSGARVARLRRVISFRLIGE